MKNVLLASVLCFTALYTSAQHEKDVQSLTEMVDGIATAWTNADGEGFASYFDDEHDYFVWNGLYTSNMTRKQNAEGHDRLFTTVYHNTKHYAVLDKIRFVTEDVAVLMVMSAITAKGDPAPEHPQVLWSATVHKTTEGWKIVSFHNADIEILATEESRQKSPIPIESMYGKWYQLYASK